MTRLPRRPGASGAGGEVREYVHRYAYDRFGRLSETAYPSGLRTRREYGARGHLAGLWTGRTLLQETKATDARGCPAVADARSALLPRIAR